MPATKTHSRPNRNVARREVQARLLVLIHPPFTACHAPSPIPPGHDEHDLWIAIGRVGPDAPARAKQAYWLACRAPAARAPRQASSVSGSSVALPSALAGYRKGSKYIGIIMWQ
jgi:hypothetical protein